MIDAIQKTRVNASAGPSSPPLGRSRSGRRRSSDLKKLYSSLFFSIFLYSILLPLDRAPQSLSMFPPMSSPWHVGAPAFDVDLSAEFLTGRSLGTPGRGGQERPPVQGLSLPRTNRFRSVLERMARPEARLTDSHFLIRQ